MKCPVCGGEVKLQSDVRVGTVGGGFLSYSNCLVCQNAKCKVVFPVEI